MTDILEAAKFLDELTKLAESKVIMAVTPRNTSLSCTFQEFRNPTTGTFTIRTIILINDKKEVVETPFETDNYNRQSWIRIVMADIARALAMRLIEDNMKELTPLFSRF